MKTRTRSATLFMAWFLLLSLPAAADWPMLQHDPAHTGFTPEAGPQTDNLLWQWVPDESGPETSRSVPPVSEGRVYTIVQGHVDDNWELTDGQVVCLDARTGTEIWRYHRWRDSKIDNHPVVCDGRIYFTATTTPDAPWAGLSSVCCLDAETGTELWVGGVFGTAGSMVVGNGIVFTTSTLQYDYYYGSYYYYLRAYDAGDGTPLWYVYHFIDDGRSYARPCVQQDRVYSGWMDGNLLCLDATSGATIWERALTPSGHAPTFYNGKVYYFASGEGLIALDPENGETFWSQPELSSLASIAAAEGQLFLVGGSYGVSGTVTAVDAESGAVNWSQIVADVRIGEEPAVAGDKLYAASSDGILYCLDTDTGSTVWSHDPGGHYPSSPSVSDGNLYLTDHVGSVYCYGSNNILTAGLTCSPPPGQQSIDAVVDLSMTNLVPDAPRRFVFQINLTDPDGFFDLNWNRGWQNIQAGETWSASFTHSIPGLEGNWGTVLFEMEALDVTPAPYNQPPYPPAGLLIHDSCSAEVGLVDASLACAPSSGTLPFASQFEISMTNSYTGIPRRLLYEITVTLANEQYYPNWRRGWQNVPAGESFLKSWWQTIPAYVPLIGVNDFALTVTDVTPEPYNQAPYPPSGDTATDNCSITASEAP